jgi:hypothetical protein
MTLDAGKTWVPVKGAPGGDDYHQLWIDPKDGNRMVLSSDQGTVVSVDGAKTWSTWYYQPTAQIYHVAADNRFLTGSTVLRRTPAESRSAPGRAWAHSAFAIGNQPVLRARATLWFPISKTATFCTVPATSAAIRL